MRINPVLIAIIICASTVQSFAQNRRINHCRLTFVAPDGFDHVEIDDDILTYQSPRAKTFFAMSKTIRDSHQSLFTARSIGMEHFNDVVFKEETFGAELSEETFSKRKFTIVRWFRKNSEKSFSYHIAAYNDDCDVVYKIEICGEGKREADMQALFNEVLESCDSTKKR